MRRDLKIHELQESARFLCEILRIERQLRAYMATEGSGRRSAAGGRRQVADSW